MPKKSTAEINMAEAIRDVFAANPKATSAEAIEAIKAKYPKAKINKNSFSVAFYTTRKKLGIGSSKRGKRFSAGRRRVTGSQRVDISLMEAAAKFIGEIGGTEAALELIKQVQAVQMK